MQCNTEQISTKGTEVAESDSVNLKLEQVLKKLLEPNFKLQNNDYLNLLFTHLINRKDSKSTLNQKLVTEGILEQWIGDSFIEFERNKDSPNSTLLTFVLNVTRCVCKKEQSFNNLNEKGIFERLIKITGNVYKSNVITALIKLLADFLDHPSGVQWILTTNHWKLVVDIILNDGTIYAYKEGYLFINKLLQRSFVINQPFCINIFRYILTPLEEISNTVSEIQNKHLSSILRFVTEILVILFKSDSSVNSNRIISICIENTELEKKSKQLISTTDNLELRSALYRIVIFLGLFNLKLKLCEQNIKIEKDTSSEILDILYEAANNVSVSGMSQLLFSTLHTWSEIKKSLPHPIRISISFEDQLLAIQLMPMYTIFVKTIGFNVYTSDCEDSFRYLFISKLVDRLYPKTVRIKYKWQNYLLDNYSISNGILSLKYFMHSKQFYSKENAVLIFQMMIYLMHDLNTTLKEKPELQLQFVNVPEYLELHLKVIGIIIEEFKLTFRDSIESLCVLNIVYNLLDGLIWPTKIVVAALKLAETGISKYMTFQMSLYIDDKQGSIIGRLPALLRIKLHDGAWEVRDSAIEVLQSLFVTANNTESSAYKKLLLENDLPCLMVKMGTDDGNSFVRATALRCIQKTVEIPEFWEALTQSFDIYSTVLRVLKHETEGIVRCEAAALVYCIYQHQEIPVNVKNDVLDAMSHAVVADLHWEVRVKAMPFWKKIIDDSLSEQGLIDGSFPNVTFSKDLRKIVTLDSVEIKKSLVRALWELSKAGCLFVFYEALQDECDIEVAKSANENVKDFVKLLRKHEVTVETLRLYTPSKSPTDLITKTPDEPRDSFNTNNSENSLRNQQISDSILEDILDTRDLNLLETVFNSTDKPVFENIETKQREVLQPELFLNLVYTDLDSRLNNKTTWVEKMDDFKSLLDDILKEYDSEDVNSLDCY
ncbi:uncharacterized protein LOC130900107 [Diorhabda carinulata]|uniref:uncharacterized protein LOC130900107 n=1 Tax=Diorhabda carinulata TaxID=1163345 RepID=UPI0025A2BF74|nr:uncharacterized protein LOC130900107 [Diorhabda carinulata]